MKKMLECLLGDGCGDCEVIIRAAFRIYTIFKYSDGTICVRISGSGLMSPIEKPSVAGLRRLLDWIDEN